MTRKSSSCSVFIPVFLTAFLFLPTPSLAAKEKIFAQALAEQALAKHPEISGIELAVRSSTGCLTVAASDPKDIGEKCDKDELEPMRTGKPSVEKEKDGFDVTLAIHDRTGEVIGTVGMDFKAKPGQQRSSVIEAAEKIRQELEAEIPSLPRLLEPVD